MDMEVAIAPQDASPSSCQAARWAAKTAVFDTAACEDSRDTRAAPSRARARGMCRGQAGVVCTRCEEKDAKGVCKHAHLDLKLRDVLHKLGAVLALHLVCPLLEGLAGRRIGARAKEPRLDNSGELGGRHIAI